MADPRERLSQGLRALSTPPPPRPAAVPPPPKRPAPAPRSKTTPAKDSTPAKQAAPPEEETPAPAKRTTGKGRGAKPAPDANSDDLFGRPYGNKRSATVYLPIPVREALDATVTDEKSTKGVIIMRALRETHAELTKRHRPAEQGSGSDLFPPERAPTRRSTGNPKVPTTFTLWPDEARAVGQVADELTAGNVSQLVAEALSIRLGVPEE